MNIDFSEYAQMHNEYGVSSSALSKWPHRSPSVRELENRSVRAAVLEPCAQTEKRLETREIKDCLNRVTYDRQAQL